MAQQRSFGSNNPFRRKAPLASAPSAPPPTAPPFAEAEGPTPSPGTTPVLPPGDQFRSHLQALAHPNQPPPATSFQKPKVVKKVRVQSPPPSSPESSGVPDRFASVGQDDDESSSSGDADEQVDLFSSGSSRGSVGGSDGGGEASYRPPQNPFQKTKRDLHTGLTEQSENSSTAPGTRTALDVDAFGQLLLTGQISGAGTLKATAAPFAQTRTSLPGGDGASTTDTSSTSRQSITDTIHPLHETPRTSHETLEHDAEEDQRGLISTSQSSLRSAPTIPRQKPPPPSSRHGKLIKAEWRSGPKGAEGGSKPSSTLLSCPTRRSATTPPISPSSQGPAIPSDINKPLPPAPQRLPAEEEAESVFDRVAAGKVPEPDIEPEPDIIVPPRPPTPPNVSHATSSGKIATPQPSKKPAPPPRRQPHGRSESKAAPSAKSSVQQDDEDSSLRRSSNDSARSRSSSLRVSIHAPAPPPPRRPGHASRTSVSLVSPSLASFSGITSPGSERGQSESASPAPATDHSFSIPLSASPPPIGDTPSSGSSRDSPATVTPISPRTAEPASASPLPPPTNLIDNRTQPHPQLQPQSHAQVTQPKIFPAPPPPPARGASVRAKRPASGASAVVSRKETRGKEGSAEAAPPPPPRHRGSSRGSVDGQPVVSCGASAPETITQSSSAPTVSNSDLDSRGSTSTSMHVGESRDEEAAHAASSEAGGSGSAAVDILADLSLLQKEVDALRGRYEKAGLGGGGGGE
ncbi:hypothetical protein VTK56DRAFT_1464 [Thermocarpiscus australiensis]